MKTVTSKLKNALDYAQMGQGMQEHADHHYGNKSGRVYAFKLFCSDFFKSLFNCK